MALRLSNVTIDAQDHAALAAFWRHARGYRVAYAEPHETGNEPPKERAGRFFGALVALTCAGFLTSDV